MSNSTNITNKKASVFADDFAAIATAIHLYFNEVHDVESNVITIKKIERHYSPWSSKVLGLNNLHR